MWLSLLNASASAYCVQNNIVNAERRGKRQVLIRPSSKVIIKFLAVMQRHGELLSLPFYHFSFRASCREL